MMTQEFNTHTQRGEIEMTQESTTYTLATLGDAGQLCACCGERLPDYSAVVVEVEGGYTHPLCALRRDAAELQDVLNQEIASVDISWIMERM